jgi:transaldolase
VASFFLSRIDTKVDQLLEDRLNGANQDQEAKIKEHMGKIAVASGKLAFYDYQKTFDEGESRFQPLREMGANRQRALWASTSTKNPAYPDTKYIDELIGPQTVNTLPPHTLAAFLDHGSAEVTITKDLDLSREHMRGISELGLDIQHVTQELETEGVKAFADAFSSLLDSLEKRMQEFIK